MEASTLKTVTILGCGYVGLTTAAILAHCGYKVYAVEPNPKRLDVIKSGKSFFYEQGLDDLIGPAVADGRLVPTAAFDSAAESSVVFSCVGTPDNPDGSSNLTYVFEAAKTAAKLMKPGTVYAQKSTVPAGTGNRLIAGVFAGSGVSYVSNPEFLSESTAVADTLWPARLIAGSASAQAAQKILDVYRDIEAHADGLAQIAGLTKPAKAQPATYLHTTLNSAELIKVSSNAFLAMKISFANSIAKLADAADADITEIMDAVGVDPRIGRAFLNAGRGFGGGCFPKDVSGLVRSAEDFGVELPIMHAVSETNESMPHYCINKASKLIGGNWQDVPVVVLGLSFKAGTSDVRRSPAITIANALAGAQAKVTAYDPAAMDEAREQLHGSINLAASTAAAVKDARCIFIATDWPQFVQDLPGLLQHAKEGTVVVDCMDCMDPASLPAHITYTGIGR